MICRAGQVSESINYISNCLICKVSAVTVLSYPHTETLSTLVRVSGGYHIIKSTCNKHRHNVRPRENIYADVYMQHIPSPNTFCDEESARVHFSGSELDDSWMSSRRCVVLSHDRTTPIQKHSLQPLRLAAFRLYVEADCIEQHNIRVI